jgi:hypothetical protein
MLATVFSTVLLQIPNLINLAPRRYIPTMLVIGSTYLI